MKQSAWRQIILVVAAGVVFFTNLGATGLWDLDEALFASCSREMLVHHDWVVPRYNNEVFYDKPPLMYWLMIASFEGLGTSELAARLPMALTAMATALATYHLGRRLFNAEIGFWAGLIMTSTIIFTVSARAATVDAALTLATVLAMLIYAFFAIPENSTALTDGDKLKFLPSAWWVYAAVGACLGVAVLGKGPVGLLLPTLALMAFLLIVNAPMSPRTGNRSSWWHWMIATSKKAWSTFHPKQVFRVALAMRPLVALSAAAMVALPWFVLVTVQTHGDWLQQFVLKYNVRPFVQPFLGHRGPFYYHFAVIFIGLFPWSVFLGPTAIQFMRGIRSTNPQRAAYLLMACWIAAFFVFWSLCSTKLPHYVLPAYPPLAILVACFIQAWRERPLDFSRWWPRIAMGSLLVVGIAMMGALPLAAARYVPGEESIALVGATLAVGGAIGLLMLRIGRLQWVMPVYAATSIAFIVATFGWALLRIDRHQHSKPLMAAVRNDCEGTPHVAGYRFLQASTVFYAGGPTPEIEKMSDVRSFIASSPQPYIVTTSDLLPDLESQWPDGFREVARRPEFLAKGKKLVDVVVVAPTEKLKLASRAVLDRPMR